MKQIKYKVVLLYVIFIAIFIACRQELLEEPEDSSLSIDMAKDWFEAHQPEMLTLKSGDTSLPEPVAVWPDWETAFASHNNKVEVVESSIFGNGSFGFATEESFSQWASTEDMGYLTSLSRIVVLKYKKTGEIVSFIMTIVGDKEYLEKNQFRQKNNTYVRKEKDFNGLVIFQNLQGEFVNGWRFTNGEVSHKVKLNSGVSLQLKSLIVEACVSYEIIMWNMYCVDYYHVGIIDGQPDWDNATYDGTSCTDPVLSYTLVSECSYIAVDGTDGAPPGGYEPPEEEDPELLLSQDPCDQVAIIGEDADFKSKMNDLKSKTDELRESAYVLRQTPDGLFEYQYAEGPDGVLEMSLPLSYTNPADGYIHSHYNSPDALSIFSPDDIKVIYDAYWASYITSLGTFTAGVVTASGTTYLLKVEDVNAFLNFGSVNFQTSAGWNNFQTQFSTFVKANETDFFQEIGFLNMIQGSGLSLFKGDATTFNQWDLRTLNGSGLPTNSNCDD